MTTLSRGHQSHSPSYTHTHTHSRLGWDDEGTMNLPSNIYIAHELKRVHSSSSALLGINSVCGWGRSVP